MLITFALLPTYPPPCLLKSCKLKNYETYFQSRGCNFFKSGEQSWKISKYFNLYWTPFSVYLLIYLAISDNLRLSLSSIRVQVEVGEGNLFVFKTNPLVFYFFRSVRSSRTCLGQQKKLRDILQEREGTSLNYFEVFVNYIEQFSQSMLLYLGLFW